MTYPGFFILVAMAWTSAMPVAIFYLAWKTQGQKPHALTWTFACVALTGQ